MAGDWIKFETGTPDKPEVWLIAGALNIDPDAVVGKLLRVWGWFDQHTENGVAPIQTKAMLDRLSGVSGFCEAVAKAGWLKIDGNNLILPGFEKHNGKTAKQRINTARRVANHKARKDGANDEGNAELTQQVTGERACIPRPVRAAVYQRDSHACVYCGRAEGEYSAGETSRDGLLSADHVIPVTRGGANTLENLVTCCLPCNLFKGDRTPDEAGLKWPSDEDGKRYGCVSQSVSGALPKEEKRRVKNNTKDTPVGVSKKTQGKKFDFSGWPELPEQQTLDDWFAMRKRIKADVSQTVINNFAAEFQKAYAAGRSVNACLQECVARNWRGFKFQWLVNQEQGNANTSRHPQQTRLSPSDAAWEQYLAESGGQPDDVLDAEYSQVDEAADSDGRQGLQSLGAGAV